MVYNSWVYSNAADSIVYIRMIVRFMIVRPIIPPALAHSTMDNMIITKNSEIAFFIFYLPSVIIYVFL